MERPGPVLRVLLRPGGLGERQPVRFVGGGNERPVDRVQGSVRPLAPYIAANDVRAAHGRMTIFRPAPERIASKASAICARGERWVTTEPRPARRRVR